MQHQLIRETMNNKRKYFFAASNLVIFSKGEVKFVGRLVNWVVTELRIVIKSKNNWCPKCPFKAILASDDEAKALIPY